MTDKGMPEYGKQYALTGDGSTPSIMRGDSWQDSEIKPEPKTDKTMAEYNEEFGQLKFDAEFSKRYQWSQFGQWMIDNNYHPSRPSEKLSDHEQRLYTEYRKAELMANVRQVIKDQPDGEYTEDDNYRDPLAITAKHEIVIELSTGGDADGLILKFDYENCLTGGVYYWADWGVYQETELTDDEARELLNFYCIDAEEFLRPQIR